MRLKANRPLAALLLATALGLGYWFREGTPSWEPTAAAPLTHFDQVHVPSINVASVAGHDVAVDRRTGSIPGLATEVPAVAARKDAALVLRDAASHGVLADRSWVLEDERKRQAEFVSGADGRIDLPAGAWTVLRCNEDKPDSLHSVGYYPQSLELEANSVQVIWRVQEPEVAVRVVAPDGQPVRGAGLLWVVNPAWEVDLPNQWSGASTVVTGAEGRAVLKLAGGRKGGLLNVSAEGFRSRQLTLTSSPEGLELQLEPETEPVVATLRFEGLDGQPVQGVEVSADTDSIDFFRGAPLQLGVSDSHGRLELPGWVEEVDQLRLSGTCFDAVLDRGEYWTDRRVIAPRPIDGHLRIGSGAEGDSLELFVRASEGVDLGVGMALEPLGGARRIGPDGVVALRLPRGVPMQVSAHFPDGRSAQTVFTAMHDAWELALQSEGFQHGWLTVTPRGGEIAALTLLSDGWPSSIRLTEFEIVDGSVRVPVPAGLRGLFLDSTDGARTTVARRSPIDLEAHLEVDFASLHPLEIQLRDRQGEAVSDVQVRVVSERKLGRLGASPFASTASSDGTWTQRSRRMFQAEADGDGVFRFNVPAWGYQVSLKPLDWRSGEQLGADQLSTTSVTVDPGGAELELQMSRTRRVELICSEFDLSRLPEAWSVHEPNQSGDSVLVKASSKVLWIGERCSSLEIRARSGELLDTVEFASGSEPIRVWFEVSAPEVSLP